MSINDETLRLARKMRVTIDQTVDQSVDQSVRGLVRAWARAWDEIHDAWADAMMDLAQASSDGQWPNTWQIAQADRAGRAGHSRAAGACHRVAGHAPGRHHRRPGRPLQPGRPVRARRDRRADLQPVIDFDTALVPK